MGLLKDIGDGRYEYDFIGTADIFLFDSKAKVVYCYKKFEKNLESLVCNCDCLEYFELICKETFLKVVEANWITKEIVEKSKINL